MEIVVCGEKAPCRLEYQPPSFARQLLGMDPFVIQDHRGAGAGLGWSRRFRGMSAFEA
jgi:hypothetical protein